MDGRGISQMHRPFSNDSVFPVCCRIDPANRQLIASKNTRMRLIDSGHHSEAHISRFSFSDRTDSVDESHIVEWRRAL
jgi:hypothetical protein